MNSLAPQSLINTIDQPAVFIGLDHRIVATNQAYKDAYKHQIEPGQSLCYEVLHDSGLSCDKSGEACPMIECGASKKPVSVVHVHKTQGGNKYHGILMKPVFDEADELIGFIEILEEIDYASATLDVDKMLGNSEAFKSLVDKVHRVAKTDVPVLLQGETGTGKELVARALHEANHRRGKPFVVIECSGLPEQLFESELFGHEKGAFTGATSHKKGLVELVDGGTLFFDEVADIPMNMQVKLLRLLETQSFRSVGSLKQKRSDFRLVCASHKNILEMVDRGEFRKDLYYRIAIFPIHLPSLWERRSDIPQLAQLFLKSSEFSGKRFTRAAMNKLASYRYPGNIRELKSTVLQSAILSNGECIYPEDVPVGLSVAASDTLAGAEEPALKSLQQAEADYLGRVASQWSGSVEALAELLGVSSRTLYRKLKKHGLHLK